MNTRTPDAPAASAGRHGGSARAACEPLIDAVDALRQRHAAEGAARVLDQRAVERHLLQRLVEQRGEMALQAVAQRLRRRTRPLQLPVEAHPFLDQVAVQRAGGAQHQIDLGRLVEERRLLEMRPHLAFQPHDQPRQQDVLQRMAIHLARAGAEFAGLRQAGEPLESAAAAASTPNGSARAWSSSGAIAGKLRLGAPDRAAPPAPP